MTSTEPMAAALVTVDDLCVRSSALPREDSALLCGFARLFFAKVPRTMLEERTPDELGATAVGAWEFLLRSRPDGVNVELADPREEGWPAPVTVIRAEVGDRPFIVDTIREYLNAENIPILHYIYPVLRVERDEAGRITAVGAEAGATGGAMEALVHCKVAPVASTEQRGGGVGRFARPGSGRTARARSAIGAACWGGRRGHPRAGRLLRGARVSRRPHPGVARRNAAARFAADLVGKAVVDTHSSGGTVAAYGDASWQPHPRLRLRGGARADAFSHAPFPTASPRAAATWLVGDRAALTLAAGRHH
jgi:glutamate dehydrogenase